MYDLDKVRPSNEIRRRVDEPIRQEHLEYIKQTGDFDYVFVNSVIQQVIYEYTETGKVAPELKSLLNEEGLRAYVNYKNLYIEFLHSDTTICIYKSHIARDRYIMEVEKHGLCTQLENLGPEPWTWGDDNGN